MRTMYLALRALFLAACFVVLWAWIALSLRALDSRFGIFLPSWMHALGIPLMLLGGALALWCIVAFIVNGHGTPAPFDPPKEFVAAGPYSHVRNPMYLGGWLLLLGLSFYERSPSILLLSIVWMAAAHLLLVKFEEPGLHKRFGESFDNYCHSVHRWLPH